MALEITSPTLHSMIEQYQHAFQKHGDSPAGVLWPKGRQALRFDALTSHIHKDSFSVLDYGCGLAHLKAYLDQYFRDVTYHGADIVPDFVNAVQQKYPRANAKLITSCKDLTDSVDHVIISGAFNIVDSGDAASYLASVQKTLKHLFKLCRVSLAVNFMTDKVDFQQAGAHHVNVEDMYRFIVGNLSGRLMINQSYMPYEFTCVVFKDTDILHPDNTYGAM